MEQTVRVTAEGDEEECSGGLKDVIRDAREVGRERE